MQIILVRNMTRYSQYGNLEKNISNKKEENKKYIIE